MVKKSKVFKKSKEKENQNESIDNKVDNTNNTDKASIESELTSDDSQTGDDVAIDKTAGKATDNKKGDLNQTEAKLADMQDKYIRLSAEFDNYRKRTLREKMELSKYAGENLLLGIIPLMDDFDRALAHMDTATDSAAMKNGIDLIYTKFSEFLKQNGVKEIESVNTPFNVDLHEAVAKIPVDDKDKKGTVVDVVVKGYYLQDKVLRFSKVVVGE